MAEPKHYSLRSAHPKPNSGPTTPNSSTNATEEITSDKSPPPPPPRRYPSRVRISAAEASPNERRSTQEDEKEDLEPDAGKCSKRRSREGEEEGGDGRKRAKDTLSEFRRLFEKLSAEGERKQGERSRFDLEAYRLMRTNHDYLNSIARRLGPIDGVDVGDHFKFRAELYLLGVHCQMQADIDYVRHADGVLVAASVVSTTIPKDVAESDVLVCCGSGARDRDQKSDHRNVAMVNSIEAKNPVRVILGFRARKNVLMYVYGGLYSVEKYWKQKGSNRCCVFMFQMRRLPGQPKLDVEELVELSSPKKPCSKDETRVDEEIHPDTEVPLDTDDEILEAAPLAYEFGPSSDKGSHSNKVREALHEFWEIYDMLARGGPKTEKKPGQRLRFDSAAFSLFKERNKSLSYSIRCLGDVPGVEVGDRFNFRVELFLIGLHLTLQGDIDYIRQGESMIAVSILSTHSVNDSNNVGRSNILLCHGSGVMYERDQELEGGDMAMKNSIDAKTPVRVIHAVKNRKQFTVYVFGGLYFVEKYWRKKGANNLYFCMFHLRRLPGQRKLDVNIKEIRKTLKLKLRSPVESSEDVSGGKEKIPIRAVNAIGEDKPPSFVYMTKVIKPLNHSPPPLEGCNCINGCSDSIECACAVRNGGEIPFNGKGLIVEAKPLIYECGPSCKCPPTCHNRVSQQGIKFPLEVFKTESMGWGLRSRTFIPSGSFICEYVGELLEDEEATKRTTDEYLFAIGNNYYDESLWEGLSSIPSLQKGASSEVIEDGGFTLDASHYGNVGRFINHHCTPNLYAQNLLFDHDDKRMPHVMFFASEDIPPLQELTYHYNYTIDGVQDSDGNVKVKDCYCGSIECTGRLY